jgi:two-component system chemotaxis response regulator CheY
VQLADPSALVIEEGARDASACRRGGTAMTHAPAPSTFAKLRVLVIEGDANLGPLICEMLRRMGMRALEHASDGREALEKAAAHPFDIVICDWNLPDVTGIEVLERLHARAPRTLVVMTSARHDLESVRRAKQGGAAAYLVKPFSEAQLRTKLTVLAVEGLLRQQHAGKAEEGTGGDPLPDSTASSDHHAVGVVGGPEGHRAEAPAEMVRRRLDRVRILVADSSPRICEVLAKHLSARGAEVASATTGEEAVLRLQRHAATPFHLAIVDAALKGKLTARDFAEHVRRRPTAVLFTSARQPTGEALELELAGAAFLVKPFPLSVLDDAVDRLVPASGAPGDAATAATV